MNASAPRSPLLAHVLPFGLFLAGLAAVSLISMAAGDNAPLFLREPMYWVYPLQTLACGAALIWFWKAYKFGSAKPVPIAVLAGVVVFILWISPQLLFGRPARTDGFNPDLFADDKALYWGTLAARFLRLAVVVPLLEEIFWRGFLQRYLINEDFTKVPFGTYTPLSFWVVTVMFAAEHWGPDLIPALLTGVIYGLIAIRTKSLLACIVAHAVTNLALGLYIVATKQWGFW